MLPARREGVRHPTCLVFGPKCTCHDNQSHREESLRMKKSYQSPAVIDYGSIASTTFVTPAVASKYGIPVGNTAKIDDQNYACSAEAGLYAGEGGKNYLVLQCDKFGEYSHS